MVMLLAAKKDSSSKEWIYDLNLLTIYWEQ